jgi:enoyl-CoA hydratase/carnithine racemase
MGITVTDHGFVSLITLDRAEKHNALSLDMRDALEAALLAFDADAGKRVAVLIGAGERAFCAGADLTGAPPPTSGPSAQLDRANRALVQSTAWRLAAALNWPCCATSALPRAMPPLRCPKLR